MFKRVERKIKRWHRLNDQGFQTFETFKMYRNFKDSRLEIFLGKLRIASKLTLKRTSLAISSASYQAKNSSLAIPFGIWEEASSLRTPRVKVQRHYPFVLEVSLYRYSLQYSRILAYQESIRISRVSELYSETVIASCSRGCDMFRYATIGTKLFLTLTSYCSRSLA